MLMFIALLLFAFCRGMEAFVVSTSNKDNTNIIQSRTVKPSQLHGFLDDLLNFGKDDNAKNSNAKEMNEDEIDWNESDFQNELKKRNNEDIVVSVVDSNIMTADEEEVESKEFDGYMLRDAIFNKWGQCFDVEFQPVTTYGFRKLYLNILPFRLGSRKFRHETEFDYLCHLQAVVEILEKYDQLEYVLSQLEETNKKPRANTSPLVAVPFRLDLTEDELNKILSNM